MDLQRWEAEWVGLPCDVRPFPALFAVLEWLPTYFCSHLFIHLSLFQTLLCYSSKNISLGSHRSECCVCALEVLGYDEM